jgi:hypothetical protein
MATTISLSTVRRFSIVGVYLLIVLAGLDVLTTHWILARGATEADPLSALLIQRGALLVAKLTLLGAFGALVIARRPRLHLMAATWLAVGIYSTAVISNLLIFRMVAA